jgi:hypothetical protein
VPPQKSKLDSLIELIEKLNQIPWATIVVLVVAFTGAIVAVFGDSTLSFEDYVKFIGGAAAGLGIARGVAAAGKSVGEAKQNGRPG